MFTKIFWQRIIERMLVSFSVGFVGTAGIADLFTHGSTFDLKARLALGATQAIGVMFAGIIGSQVGDKTSPSLLPSPPEPAKDAEGKVRHAPGQRRRKTDKGHYNLGAVAVALLVIILVVLVFGVHAHS